MKKTFKKLFTIIAMPFVALVVHIGTSREINEHGDWDKPSCERDLQCHQSLYN